MRMRGIASIVLIALVGGTALTASLSAAYFFFLDPSDDSSVEVPLRNDSAEILTDGSDSDDISAIERFLLQPFGGPEQPVDSGTQTTDDIAESGDGQQGEGSQIGSGGGQQGSGSQTGSGGGQQGSGSQTGSGGGQQGGGSQGGSPRDGSTSERAFISQPSGNYFIRPIDIDVNEVSPGTSGTSVSESGFPFTTPQTLPADVQAILVSPTSSLDTSSSTGTPSPGGVDSVPADNVSSFNTTPAGFVSDVPTIDVPPGGVDSVPADNVSSSNTTPAGFVSDVPTIDVPNSSRRPRYRSGNSTDVLDRNIQNDADKYGVGDILSGLLIAVGAGVLACFAGSLLSSFTSLLSVSTTDTTTQPKECSLDTIAYNVARSVAYRLVADYITWASSGFEGKPLFIDNPQAYWSSIVDKEIGRALDTAGFGFLCRGGLSIDIELELRASYSKYVIKDDSCSLSDYESNIKNFLDNPEGIVNVKPTFNPTADVKVVDFNAVENPDLGREISNTIEGLIEKAVTFDPDETPPGQLAQNQAEIERRRAEVGEKPTARESTENKEKPSSISATKDCSEDEKRFSAGFCAKIAVDANTITDNIQDAVKAQVEALGLGDELGEVVGDVIQATIFGLLKRGFAEASEILTSTKTLRREAARIDRNPAGYSDTPSFELYESITVYDTTANNVFISLLEIDDINILLTFVNRSYSSGELSNPNYNGSGSYKRINDRFFPSFYRETLPHVQASRVRTFIDAINDSSRPIGQECVLYEREEDGAYASDDTRTCLEVTTVYGPGFTSSDFSTLKNILREGQTQLAEQKRIYEALESVLLSTIDAHNIIIEVSEESFNDNLVISEIRNDFLSLIEEDDICDDFPPEVPSSERLRCVVNRIFSEGRAPLYVNNNSFQILNSLSRELAIESEVLPSACVLDPSVSFRPSNVPRSARLIKTSCTIRDLINVITYTQNLAPSSNAIPLDPGLLVEFVYETARNTNFVILPVDSEIGILELTSTPGNINNYQNNQRLSENYSLLTDFFAGESDEVILPFGQAQYPEQVNFGAYTARQSREIYIENVGEKLSPWFTRKLFEVFPSG